MVATFEQLRTKNLKTFDELRAKPKPPDYGMAAIPRKKLPGVWEYDKQLEQLFDQDLDSLVPMDVKYDFGRIVGMTEKPDVTKDRIKNSLFYSIVFGRPPEVTFNLLDELNKIAFKKPIDVKKAMEEYSDYYKGAKNYTGVIRHGFRRAGMWMVGGLAGKAKMAGELTLPTPKARRKKVIFPNVRDWGIEQSEKLIEWSDMMLAAVDEYYQENKAEAIQITPGLGYVETLKEYVFNPKNLVQGIIESGPMILEGILGTTLGGAALGITAMSLPITGNVYADARKEGTDVVPAFAQSVLTGVGEATIEQWTLSKKLGLTKNFKKLVADGLPKITWEGTKAFVRGTAEEGSQEFNRNFWRWLFTDRSQAWMANVKESMAAGGPMELAMAGVFSAAGYVGTPVIVAEQLDRIDKIQDAVNAEQTLTSEHKAEIKQELDKVRDDVKSGVYEPPAEPTEKAPSKPVKAKAPPKAKITPAQPKAVEVAAEEKLPKELRLEPIRVKRKLSGKESKQVAQIKREIGELETQKKNKLGQWLSTKSIKAIERQQDELRNQLPDEYETRPPNLQDYKKALKWYEKNKKEKAATILRQWITGQETHPVAKAEPAKVAKPAEKPIQKAIKIEKEIIPKQTQEKFTPPVVQKETKTQIPESDSETQNAANLMEGYWREYDERELEINVAATKNQEAITKALDKKQYLPESDIETSKMSQAMMLYIDLKEHPSGHQFAEELSKLQKEIYELSKDLPAKIQKIADSIIEQNRKAGALALDKEVIANARENYIAHLWQRPTREETYRARFRQKTARAKARTLEGGIMEGWAKGKTLRVNDVTLATQIAQSQINQAIVGKELLKMGKKWGLLSHKQPEGWVRVEHPGFTTWRHAGTVEVEKGTIKEGQWVRPADRKNLGRVTMVKGDRAMVHFRNKETGLEETKEFPIDQLKVVRSYGKNFFITEEGDLMEKLPVYAEPELGKKLNNVFSPSALYKVPGIETISRYNAQIKSTILFTSLYHHQAFLRSYAFGSRGLNPKTAYEKGRQSILNMTPEVRLLVRNGLTIGRIQDYDPRMIEGEQTIWGRALSHTKLTEAAREKLVALRKRQERFLFSKMGPALKIQAGILELKAELKRNQVELESGEITADEIAAAVANLMNNDFGGLHLGRMGRSQTAQHLFRLLCLAPDWTESNIRSAVQAFAKGEMGYLHRMFWGRIAAKGLGATILFNLLLSAFDDDDFAERYRKAWETGRLRWLDIDITPIYKALGGDDDKRKYFSLLGHFRDPVKFVVHPFISMKHKGSVVSRVMLDMMIGQDWAGREFTTIGELLGITEDGKLTGRLVKYGRSGAKPIEPAQIPSYVLYQVRSAMPIPMQNLIAFLGGELDAFDALTKSLGLMTATTYPERKKKSKKITR